MSRKKNLSAGAWLRQANDAAEAHFAFGVGSERQNDIGALDGAKLVQDGAWTVAQSGAHLPLLQGFPKNMIRAPSMAFAGAMKELGSSYRKHWPSIG